MADGTTLEVVNEDDGKETRLILVGDCKDNEALQDAVKKLGHEVVESETGSEYIEDNENHENVFIVSNFSGDVFKTLHKAEVRTIGPPIVIKCASNDQDLPYNIRPHYCTSMEGIKVCFAGFKDRHEKRRELCELVDLVYYMSGNVRRDFKCSVTHLVADVIGGEKYDYAVGLGRPVMNADWIRRLWAERDTPGYRGDDPNVTIKYKLPPFYKQCLSFLGFSKDEQNHMEEVTIENGGTFSSVGDPECTHLIVDEAVQELPTDVRLPKHVVKGEWFWCCVQMEACAGEKIYKFQKSEGYSNHFTPNSSISGSQSKSRKRRRLKENIAQLASDEELESPLYGKRRSSDLGGIISPNSFLDASYTPDKSDANISKTDKEQVKVTPRLQVVKEFLQTEKNYVGILHTLLNTFKAQIEKQDQYNGPILVAPDVKLIFGTVPAIYNIHCAIRDELSEMVDNWNEEHLVGSVISKNADALVKAYPPFVNYFDDTKERITKCDKLYPRFHAFLKVCLTKPECGRQTLTELLIRPVQRLPSITLLLNDILKHTSKTNPDHGKLEEAANVLKEVMTHINEDRRKTESQVVMFDIMNDIEDCPAHVLSSHRAFVSRLDVVSLSDVVCRRGTPLSLFLFSDCVVICKRRLKVLHSRSPLPSRTPKKGFEHKEFVPLQSVRRVLDFTETEDCRGAFGLIVKNAAEMKETFLSFMIDSKDVEKRDFITLVAKNIANTLCRADCDSLISIVEGHQLDINTKALRKATSRFSINRAFSFNKTPRRIKRAVSHVFSPFVKDSHSNYTPGELRGRRMASTIDLTEDSISLANFEDSDTISLGAFSLKENYE